MASKCVCVRACVPFRGLEVTGPQTLSFLLLSSFMLDTLVPSLLQTHTRAYTHTLENYQSRHSLRVIPLAMCRCAFVYSLQTSPKTPLTNAQISVARVIVDLVYNNGQWEFYALVTQAWVRDTQKSTFNWAPS